MVLPTLPSLSVNKEHAMAGSGPTVPFIVQGVSEKNPLLQTLGIGDYTSREMTKHFALLITSQSFPRQSLQDGCRYGR